MKFTFDYYNNLERVEFTLCNPDGRKLFPIHATNRNASLRFNDISEITFDVASEVTLSDGTTLISEVFDFIRTKRLVYVSQIGWFRISSVQENDEGKVKVKSVKAESYQCIFKDRGVISEERVYCLYNQDDPADDDYSMNNEDGIPSVVGQMKKQLGIQIADEFSGSLQEPSEPFDEWTVSYINSKFMFSAGEGICRTLADGLPTGYEWMAKQVEDAFNAIFIFDFLNKAIYITDVDEVATKTDVIMSFRNFMKNIKVEEESEDIVTVLNCTGKNCDITSVNPTGTNYICDFSYYMDEDTHRWMSQELIDKIKEWHGECEDKRSEYEEKVRTLGVAYNALTKNQSALEAGSLFLTNLKNAQSKAISKFNFSTAEVLKRAKASDDYDVIRLLGIYNEDYSEYMALARNLHISSRVTTFGNVKTKNRTPIRWDETSLRTFESAISSWGMRAEDLGDYSTVLGAYMDFDLPVPAMTGTMKIPVAFTTILQGETPILLSRNDVCSYINMLSTELGDRCSAANLLKEDKIGRDIGNNHISNIIASVGANAEDVSKIMHYTGCNGKLANDISNIATELNISAPGGYSGLEIVETVNPNGNSIDQDSPFSKIPFTDERPITAYATAPQWNVDKQIWSWGVIDGENFRSISELVEHNQNAANEGATVYWYFEDTSPGKPFISYCKLKVAVKIDPNTKQKTTYCSGFDRYIVSNYPLIDYNTGDAIYMDCVSDWIAKHQKHIDHLNKETERAKTIVQSRQQALDDIASSLNINNYFSQTPELKRELSHYWFEGDFENENISVTDETTQSQELKLSSELLESGKIELAKVSQPRFSFTVDAIDIRQYEYRDQLCQLELGKIVRIEKEYGKWFYPALLGVDFSLDVRDSWSMTFANSQRLDDWGYTYADLISKASSASRKVSANWSDMTAYSRDREKVASIINDPLNATLRAGTANATNQEFQIDQNGIMGRKKSDSEDKVFEDEQVRLINNQILFTDDNWETAKAALGKILYTDDDGELKSEYGLIADVIIGSLIMGKRLKISNTDSTIELGEEGIIIKNSDGETVLKADTNGNGEFSGILKSKAGEIAGFKIGDKALYSGNKTSLLSDESGVYVGDDGFSVGEKRVVKRRFAGSLGNFDRYFGNKGWRCSPREAWMTEGVIAGEDGGCIVPNVNILNGVEDAILFIDASNYSDHNVIPYYLIPHIESDNPQSYISAYIVKPNPADNPPEATMPSVEDIRSHEKTRVLFTEYYSYSASQRAIPLKVQEGEWICIVYHHGEDSIEPKNVYVELCDRGSITEEYGFYATDDGEVNINRGRIGGVGVNDIAGVINYAKHHGMISGTGATSDFYTKKEIENFVNRLVGNLGEAPTVVEYVDDKSCEWHELGE